MSVDKMSVNKKKSVRTRFAPSPTGQLHIGGARTALFNYLYARAFDGQFVLRIEDTDQQRHQVHAEKEMLRSLEWLGICADEDPQKGGPFGPYRQSERLAAYRPYTDRLLQDGSAYPCFCSDEELSEKQREAKVLGKPYIYDGKCRALSAQEIETRKKAGKRYAIRFRTSSGEIVINDLVQGKVKFDSRLIGDFIIVKSDGFPSYNYAVVIDDHAMQISHIIRGVGHLSNTPRQILISQALDLGLAQYAHVAEIVGSDRKKLSKRQGAFSTLFFRDLGYLPQACRNYMALLGWYPRDGVEFMPDKGELERKFDIIHCSKSPAMFDFFSIEDRLKDRQSSTASPPAPAEPSSVEELSEELSEGSSEEATVGAATVWKETDWRELEKYINRKSKLNWLNSLYLRHLPLTELWEQALPWMDKEPLLRKLLHKEPDKLKQAFDSLRPYLSSLRELPLFLKEIFREAVTFESQEARQILADPSAQKIVHFFMQLIQKREPSNPEEFSSLIQETGKALQKKGRLLFMPIRVAASGTMQGLELPLLFSILGGKEVARRLENMLTRIE